MAVDGAGTSSVVLGDPGVVEAAAGDIRAALQRLADAGGSVASAGRQLAAGWTGRAADAASDRVVGLGWQAAVALDLGTAAEAILRDFAAELRAAQAAAEGAAVADDANIRAAARIDELVAWLAALDRGSTAPPRPVQYGPWLGPEAGPALDARHSQHPGLPVPWTKFGSVPTSLVAAPAAVAARLEQAAQDMTAAAGMIARDATAAEVDAYDAALRAAEQVSRQGARLSDLGDVMPGSSLVARANAMRIGLPVLRNVPGLNVAFTGAGVALDLHSGMDPTLAVVKNVGSTAAGMATVAGLVLLSGGALTLLPAVGIVLVGAAVSYLVGVLISRYGATVARAVSRAAGAVTGAASRAVGSVASAVSGTWRKVFW